MTSHTNIVKVQVVCPAQLTTGGPESLHNLVKQINNLGVLAELVYYPYSSQFEISKGYAQYAHKATVLDDSASTLIVFPETLAMHGFAIRHAKVAIWWLSVDHFLQTKYHTWRDQLRYLRLALRRHRPFRGVRALNKFQHYSKCHYDASYLDENKIVHMPLAGPISEEYIQAGMGMDINNISVRKNQILFNPKKGAETVALLMDKFPQYHFIPLRQFNAQELLEVYAASKLYIDFGNHPGKERMPREAAVMGCCIVTNTRGSAHNAFDVPIPAEFKLEESDGNFLAKFHGLVEQAFHHYEQTTALFASYRASIMHEPEQQRLDIAHILRSYGCTVKI